MGCSPGWKISMRSDVSRRVLTISTSYTPPKGGIAQVIRAYSEMYPSFNHVATKSGDSPFRKIFVFFVAIFRFLYYCLFKGIQIVHVHGASYNSFKRKRIFIYLAKLLRKKVVYHVHGAEYKEFYNRNAKAVKSLFNKVDLVVALSDSWKSFFENEVGHQNVRVIENVVDLPTDYSFHKDGLIHFLFLGALGQRKGIYDLLDAVAENMAVLKDVALFHIGGNGEVQKVQQRISELGLEALVVFEGWVSGSKKIQLLNLADVYILPSYNEGLPISILEAMAYRLPIISTPVGGIPEVVMQGDNGILVTPGDRKAIGEAIIKMTTDNAFCKAAGESSYIKVQPYFPDNVAIKLEAIYQELLQ